uniref:Uncharacterized protein n=1 Tax=Angiostrongylus cantonensis TaxID=6313 RepID=A0A0K0D1Y5_ANGCA
MLRAQYLLAFLIYYALAETRIQKAKVGQRVVLDIGQYVSRWRRVRDYETDEFIRHCSKFETGESCQGFVNDNGEPVDPPSNAYVDVNGRLIFRSFLETDAGFYMSPDEKPLEGFFPLDENRKTFISLEVMK